MNPVFIERGLRVLRAALVLAAAAWLGFKHASYWNIALVGLAMLAFQVQANLAQWLSMIRDAGLRQAAPGLIVAFVSQAIYAVLFYAIGFTLRVARDDIATALYPTLDDLLLVGLVTAIGLLIGEVVRKR